MCCLCIGNRHEYFTTLLRFLRETNYSVPANISMQDHVCVLPVNHRNGTHTTKPQQMIVNERRITPPPVS